MKTSSEIRYDFRQSQKCAQELENMADSLKELAEGRLGSVLQQLPSVWTGEAAEVYVETGERLKRHILENAKKMKCIASAIQSTAQRVYDAEMKAYRRAKEREYYR